MKAKVQTIMTKVNGIVLPKKLVNTFLPNHKRVISEINKIPFHTAIMNSKVLGHYVMVTNAMLKQLGVQLNDEVDIVLKEDTSVLQFKENEVLTEVLKTDEEAFKAYNALTKGKQRGIIALINQVKTEAKQIERALKIATNLKRNITDLKLLLQ